MAENSPDLRPIQVLLDPRRFIQLPEARQFRGGSRDFFDNDDKGFVQHKARLTDRVRSVAHSLRQAGQPAAFIQVRQRHDALAKSYRPLGHLFTPSNEFALVGAERAGELLFQTTPGGLERLAHLIDDKAEAEPRRVRNERTGELERRVSGYRSELGGIEDLRARTPSDRVSFSADEALRWMSQPNIIGGYIVELFRPDPRVGHNAVDALIEGFRHGIERLRGGLLVRPVLPSSATTQFGEPALYLSIQLTTGERRLIELPFLPNGRAVEMVESSLPTDMRRIPVDLTVQRHVELLAFLSEQALVRAVDLPPALESAPDTAGTAIHQVDIPEPVDGVDYPTVAIIDGGVASAPTLDKWKAGDAGLVPLAHRDERHGTFIAGLVAAASSLNPVLGPRLEPAGCRFYDLDLFPRYELRTGYYSDIEELFDTLEEKVKVAKRDYAVRVFNLSFSINSHSSRVAYSLAADRLDRISRANDVLFVVAAGNLRSTDCRPPWPKKADDAAAMLAGFGGGDHRITPPSEQILGITVGAVNPVGVAGHTPLLPTTYTRRGPGVGGARKPELAHYGGAAGRHTGLTSLTPIGYVVQDCGTSYAAPLTAATVATLDQRLARQAPRETLLALPVHRAQRTDCLDHRALRHVARDFVGFGVAPPADVLLHDEPHSVTLVFSDALLEKQRLEFAFAWPRSLVTESGACRGRADVTLVYTPPIDPGHGEEAIRVQVEAHLRQEKLDEQSGDLAWESRLAHDGADVPQGMSKTESYLVRTGLKWSPVKRYHVMMPAGRGNTSNWKLSLETLVRAGEMFPKDGVRFTLVLTISDIEGHAQVREEIRQELQNRGIVIADITLAHRLRPRA